MDLKSNNPPDVVLELTHEQATFMVENCVANMNLCLTMIMQIGREDSEIDEKRAMARPYVELNEKFVVLLQKLREAGAKEKED